MTNIAIVCGSYHKTEIERMLNLARDQAEKENLTIVEVIWVPGAMEVPLAISRVINIHTSTAQHALESLRKVALNMDWLWGKQYSVP